MLFSLHEMKKKWHVHSKNLNFFFIYQYSFKRDRFFGLYDVAHYVILMMCHVGPNLNHKSRESENFNKFRHLYYQKFPCDLIFENEYPHIVFVSFNKQTIGV